MKTVTELAFDAQADTITMLLEQQEETRVTALLMLGIIEDLGHDDCRACDTTFALLEALAGIEYDREDA